MLRYCIIETSNNVLEICETMMATKLKDASAANEAGCLAGLQRSFWSCCLARRRHRLNVDNIGRPHAACASRHPRSRRSKIFVSNFDRIWQGWWGVTRDVIDRGWNGAQRVEFKDDAQTASSHSGGPVTHYVGGKYQNLHQFAPRPPILTGWWGVTRDVLDRDWKTSK
jgi:hypothetical protein